MINLADTYYISQGSSVNEHISNIEKVCLGGCKLVQLRLKNISDEDYLSAAIKVKLICTTYGVTFIINDNLNCAIEADADGIHVGKEDISISEIKAVFKNKIIGGTANTIDDCLELIKNGIDYIGLGPFQFTSTKSNLSPILGIEGYKKIILKLNENSLETPIVAIGGIHENDVEDLYRIGISSIAVSGLLSNKPQNEINSILNNIQKNQ